MPAQKGIVYLIHLDRPLAHSQHYIGYTTLLPTERLAQHRIGQGSRFLQVVAELGITFDIVRTWTGYKKDERRLKNSKKSKVYCPVCAGSQKYNISYMQEV